MLLLFSGLALHKKVYLSCFRHAERKGEQRHYLQWFRRQGFEVLGANYELCFEGGGDAVFSDYDTLWAGYGQRSSREVYEYVQRLGKFETVFCEMVDPKFYHLDTCFTPVGADSALFYPAAFSERTQQEVSG